MRFSYRPVGYSFCRECSSPGVVLDFVRADLIKPMFEVKVFPRPELERASILESLATVLNHYPLVCTSHRRIYHSLCLPRDVTVYPCSGSEQCVVRAELSPWY
jgi:hypothetical protein